MSSKAIELMELEIKRLKKLVVILHEGGHFGREKYRAREVGRFQRILDLLELENDRELDQRGLR